MDSSSSVPSPSASTPRRKEAELAAVDHAWRASALVPLLLKAPPQNFVSAHFERPTKKKGATAEGAAIGETVDVDKLSNAPTLDWPQDSANPEALFTVACVDIDSPHPELLNRLKERHHEIELPAYRSTGVANASTPPTQRFVWLLVNVPAPHLIANGLRLAQWEPDLDALREKQELRRMAILVFKQLAPVPRHKAPEDSMEAKDRRVASLSHFIARHPEIGAQPPWAGTFFVVDTQSDEQYRASKRVADMMKPIQAPTLPAGGSPRRRRPYSPKWKGMDQTSPYASPPLAPLSPPKMGLPAQLQAGAEGKGAKAAAAAFDPDSERKQAETSGVKQ